MFVKLCHRVHAQKISVKPSLLPNPLSFFTLFSCGAPSEHLYQMHASLAIFPPYMKWWCQSTSISGFSSDPLLS